MASSLYARRCELIEFADLAFRLGQRCAQQADGYPTMALQAALELCHAATLYRFVGLSRQSAKVVRYGNLALRAYSNQTAIGSSFRRERNISRRFPKLR